MEGDELTSHEAKQEGQVILAMEPRREIIWLAD